MGLDNGKWFAEQGVSESLKVQHKQYMYFYLFINFDEEMPNTISQESMLLLF